MRIERTFGDVGAPGTYAGTSLKGSDIARGPANKIIVGDWLMHVNRGLTSPDSAWHNYRGKSLVDLLFGDGHSVGYKFPTLPDTSPFWEVAPSPANAWW